MDDNFLKKILDQFEDLQKSHNVAADQDFDPDSLEELLSGTFKELDEEISKISTKRKIVVKKLNPDAIMPSYAFTGDSGFDLYTTEDVEISPLGRSIAPTGLSFEFDENLEIQIRPKSGLALNKGLTVLNTPGTIDKGYTGEVKVILFNTSKDYIKIEKGTKIAQAVLCPVICGNYVEFLESDSLTETDRNDGGFGSTGLKN